VIDSVACRLRAMLSVAFILALFAPAPLSAQTYDRRDFTNWLDALKPVVKAAGVSEATFDHALARIEPDCTQTGVSCGAPQSAPTEPSWSERTGLPKSCDKVSQREFLEPARYFPESYIAALVRKGQTLLSDMRRNRPDTFQNVLNIEQTYGVPVPILMGLWARETSFGDADLPHNAVVALASLAYAGPEARRPWMRRQLIAALRMLDGGYVPFNNFRSSWAGATGLTQIMPEEYLKFGADGDGDGIKNIWTSVPDALATTANVLRNMGWRPRQGWGREVRLPETGDGWDCTREGRASRQSLRRWAEDPNIVPVDRGLESTSALLIGEESSYPLTPTGTLGPAFLVGDNFDVLRAYNPSDLYALFIGYIADRLGCDTEGAPCTFVHPWPQPENAFEFSVENICRLQLGLKANGMLPGEADGLFGPMTRAAIGRYQKAQGGKATCYPSRELFDQLGGDWKSEAMHQDGAPVTR
jgi:lytic murein transglycosylase